MKLLYAFSSMAFFSALLFCLFSCKPKPDSNNNKISGVEFVDTIKTRPNTSDVFTELRKMAISVSPKQLGIELPKNPTIVYGVVMDWDLGDGIASIVAFQTGDASLYLSTGGGAIGGGSQESVKKVARQFIGVAQSLLTNANKTQETPLPTNGGVKFYLLTNDGIFVGQETLKNFESNSSTWQKLFEEGNNLIAELKITSNK